MALSATLTNAFSAAVLEGVNVTLMAQVAEVASVDGEMGQLLLCAKSPLFAPSTIILLIVKDDVPVFVSVTV